MTDNTKRLIIEFGETKNTKLLPGIFIGIQEEDNVAEIISFKNCLKLVRNIAAHEPAVLVNQIVSPDNIGSSKIVLQPLSSSEDVQKRVVLDMVHFTAWLFDAKLILDNVAYLVLWKHLIDFMYPDMCRQLKPSKQFLLYEEAHDGKAVRMFVNLQEYMWEEFKEVKTIGVNDPYTIRMLMENPKMFWRLAIPNMMEIVKLFASDSIALTNDNNLNGYIKLLKSREGI